MTCKTISGTLASAVADAGTFTVAYPAHVAPQSGTTDEGDFYAAVGHKLVLRGGDVLSYPEDFGITIDATQITVTNKSGSSWAANTDYTLQMEQPGKGVYRDDATGQRMASMCRADTFMITLGAPDVLDADGIAVAQAVGAAGNLTLAGALTSGGVATFDVPRNVTVTSSNAGDTTQTATVYGTDVYGDSLVETISFNGAATIQGVKAFKTVTRVAISAALAGNGSAGSGDKLGLPVFLPEAGFVLKEIEDGVAATAGTIVAGVLTAGGATATSGDIRGTYDPNSACDGAKVFQLIVALPDPGYIGATQYAGTAL